MKTVPIASLFDRGDALDGWVRLMLYQGKEGHVIDERPFKLIRRMIEELPADLRPTPKRLKEAVKQQSLLLLLDENRAITTLPKLLHDLEQRREAVAVARKLAEATGALSETQICRFREIEIVLGLRRASEIRPVTAANVSAR